MQAELVVRKLTPEAEFVLVFLVLTYGRCLPTRALSAKGGGDSARGDRSRDDLRGDCDLIFLSVG